MPSSKGKPTDPKLRENVKEKIKNETNKDGGGKGQWSAWKAAKLSKEYERRGGSYENEAGSKNEPKKGAPIPKSGAKKQAETDSSSSADQHQDEEKEEEKPKPNTGKKAKSAGLKETSTSKKATGTSAAKRRGENDNAERPRRSARVAEKRKEYDEVQKAGSSKKSKR